MAIPLTRELVAALREAHELAEQAAVEAALFTARSEEERRLVLDLLRERARNRGRAGGKPASALVAGHEP